MRLADEVAHLIAMAEARSRKITQEIAERNAEAVVQAAAAKAQMARVQRCKGEAGQPVNSALSP